MTVNVGAIMLFPAPRARRGQSADVRGRAARCWHGADYAQDFRDDAGKCAST